MSVQCEQQPGEEEEEEEVVQHDIEAVVVEGPEEDVEEEEESVVLQEESCPAVIVEEVPSAQVEECYSAQVLVYDDETYLMQDVAEEQEVVTEVVTEVAENGEINKKVWCKHKPQLDVSTADQNENFLLRVWLKCLKKIQANL